ncbi:hypothetical protein B0H13DRAFT_1860550 [Mycena leptocephala]|nr:hypothetical protein B0H13DRAFT_1860550 [Mycena leptocephala]
MANDKSPIWAYFWPRPGTNASHQRAACKACVAHILEYPPAELQEAPPLPVDPASVKARFNHVVFWQCGAQWGGYGISPQVALCSRMHMQSDASISESDISKQPSQSTLQKVTNKEGDDELPVTCRISMKPKTFVSASVSAGSISEPKRVVSAIPADTLSFESGIKVPEVRCIRGRFGASDTMRFATHINGPETHFVRLKTQHKT